MAAERPPVEFGRKLREAREKRGVSLRQIASATKISMTVLEALERNDISRLPGGIFGRAFVRSYAIEVGLNPEDTIQDFIAQFPQASVTAGHRASDPVEDHLAIESDRRTASTFLRLAAISVPVVAVVIYVTTGGLQWLRRPPAAPADAGTPPASAVPDSPVAAPPSPLALEPAAEHVTPGADAAPASAATDRLTVGLDVTRPCWVVATVDGQKTIERLLQPGDAQTIDVKREIVLTAGDASAVAMTLNGVEAKPLGKPGEVVTRRLNLANFKEYVQPK